MKVYFGLELDDLAFPRSYDTNGGIHYLGNQTFLTMLESHLGLAGHDPNNEYIRIEQYRQVLHRQLKRDPDIFYHASFAADELATATTLLSMRDELVLADWDFDENNKTPIRLATLAQIEQVIRTEDYPLRQGFADRFMAVYHKIGIRKQPIKEIFINEPFDLLPRHYNKLFVALELNGVEIIQLDDLRSSDDSDLGRFRQSLLQGPGKRDKMDLKLDGSLLILKAKRETDAAAYLSKLLKANPDFRPLCLIPEKNRSLDMAIVQEGLPSLGILSASSARPSLQILKLVTAFLWEPIDIYKILEFCSLSLKPLNYELSRVIAKQISSTPGIGSNEWKYAVDQFFREIEDRAATNKRIKPEEIKREYKFWFEHNRYNVTQSVPKVEVIQIFKHVAQWAYDRYDKIYDKKEEEKNIKRAESLLVLSEQAKRISELLETLPENETHLSQLQIERIVRTIFEPSPVQLEKTKTGHLPYIYQASSVISQVDEIIWWNFIRNEKDHFFSRWYIPEREYLETFDIQLKGPKDENDRVLWQRLRPVIQCKNRLVLILPEMVNGEIVHPHPLFDDLQACYEAPGKIILDIDDEKDRKRFESFFKLPKKEPLANYSLGTPKAFLKIDDAKSIVNGAEETLTSLEQLFYYPYKWLFKFKINLRKSSILSIVDDRTLMGNLAHSFFEMMFKKSDIINWTKNDVYTFIDKTTQSLLETEGAVLLMYGREPERVSFIKKVKFAAWSLLHMIQENGWKVKGCEMELKGEFMGIPVKGKADLVLVRRDEMAIVDFKWAGSRRREEMIKNEEDLQLIMYSKLLENNAQWAHTAYYTMFDGKLIARNTLAFKEAIATNANEDHMGINQRIWEKMEKTFKWRIEQLKKGSLEIRCQSTAEELEEIYGTELLELLEMPSEDARYDDYRSLINLTD